MKWICKYGQISNNIMAYINKLTLSLPNLVLDTTFNVKELPRVIPTGPGSLFSMSYEYKDGIHRENEDRIHDLTKLYDHPKYNGLTEVRISHYDNFPCDTSKIIGLQSIQFPPSLTNIDISNVQNCVFNNYPPNLLKLTMINCMLETIPANLPKSLVTLKLYRNNIKGDIILDIKNNFPNLTELNLIENKITNIRFSSMSDKLKVVGLSNNKLSDASFICAPFTIVELNNNQITTLPDNLPDTLTILKLSDNKITHLPANLIHRLVNDTNTLKLSIENNPLVFNTHDSTKLICAVQIMANMLDIQNTTTLEQLRDKIINPDLETIRYFINNCNRARIERADATDAALNVLKASVEIDNQIRTERERAYIKKLNQLILLVNVLWFVMVLLCARIAYWRW